MGYGDGYTQNVKYFISIEYKYNTGEIKNGWLNVFI